MFCGCSSLKKLPDISLWNTSKIISLDGLFYKCSSLIDLPDISIWDTSNVMSFKFLFYDCSKLKSLPDISKWKTDKNMSLSNLFFNCSSLGSIPDISKWNIFNYNKENFINYKTIFDELKNINMSEIIKLNSFINSDYNDIYLENYSVKLPEIEVNLTTIEEYINFELLYGEEIFKKHNQVQTINPRAYTTFCKAISGISDWNDDKALALILNISKGCFLNDKDNVVGNLFTTFISMKLDKLIAPKDMLMQKWETVEPKIHDCVYEGERMKTEIASILAIRLLNYIMFYFSQNGAKQSIVEDRLLDFIENPRKLFSDDLLFHVIKTIIGKYPGKTTKLLINSKIRSKVMA